METIVSQQPNFVSPQGCIPLPEATCLRRRYTVRRVTGFDDCSITYDGFDFKARQPVSIVEFFPRTLAMRALSTGTVSPLNRESGALYFLGSEAFLNQYNALTQAIGSPNIISVFEAFFENGTAYAVTERIEGVTLADYLRIHGRTLTENELAAIVRALSDALLIVHSLNVLHHGINADRILICPDGTVKLMSFCAAHETVQSGHDVLKREPYSDILALGQALYLAYTGMPAPLDPSLFRAAMPETLRAMFERMLTASTALRFSSVFDLLYAVNSLDIEPAQPSVSDEQVEAFQLRQRAARQAEQLRRSERAHAESACQPDAEQPGNAKKTRGWLVGICALAALFAIALVIRFLTRT